MVFWGRFMVAVHRFRFRVRDKDKIEDPMLYEKPFQCYDVNSALAVIVI